MYSGVTFYTNNPLCLRASVVNRVWTFLINRLPGLHFVSLGIHSPRAVIALTYHAQDRS